MQPGLELPDVRLVRLIELGERSLVDVHGLDVSGESLERPRQLQRRRGPLGGSDRRRHRGAQGIYTLGAARAQQCPSAQPLEMRDGLRRGRLSQSPHQEADGSLRSSARRALHRPPP